jgi:hypothetical protein
MKEGMIVKNPFTALIRSILPKQSVVVSQHFRNCIAIFRQLDFR